MGAESALFLNAALAAEVTLLFFEALFQQLLLAPGIMRFYAVAGTELATALFFQTKYGPRERRVRTIALASLRRHPPPVRA